MNNHIILVVLNCLRWRYPSPFAARSVGRIRRKPPSGKKPYASTSAVVSHRIVRTLLTAMACPSASEPILAMPRQWLDTNSAQRSLSPIEPASNCISRSSSGVTCASGRCGLAPVEIHRVGIGQNEQRVGVNLAGKQGGGQICRSPPRYRGSHVFFPRPARRRRR